ncbi:hypothetical protein RUM44_010146 [Polyplax serrata]|uniref:Uncharacterized protein n=1 Tax=Polyplax serrata TaxID=468196 RepID=A0ABR1AUR1_POLSC
MGKGSDNEKRKTINPGSSPGSRLQVSEFNSSKEKKGMDTHMETWRRRAVKGTCKGSIKKKEKTKEEHSRKGLAEDGAGGLRLGC